MASLVAQMVKNLPAEQETWVPSLGWDDPLEEGMALQYTPTPVFLPGESQGQEAWLAAIYGAAQSRTRLKRFSSSSSCKEPTHWKRP